MRRERPAFRLDLRHVCLLAALLAGCVQPAGDAADSSLPTAPPVNDGAAPPPSAVPSLDSTVDPNAPAILLEQPLGSETLYLIRYPSAGQVCLTATLNPYVFATQHCGPFEGAGVGFLDTISDSAGQPVRLAYGLALDTAITAVAVEYVEGGSDNTFTQNGGYVLVLAENQMPRRALGIDQYGYLVGSWGFR